MFPVLDNQPTLFDRLDALDWASVPVTAWAVDDDRGRHELRTVQVLPAPPELNLPHVAQVFLIERTVTVNGKVLHWIRDVTFREDSSRIRTGNTPRVMATLRNAVVSLLRIHELNNHRPLPPDCQEDPL